jgi:hypothetical protein
VQHIENMNGRGTVTSNIGEEIAVRYDLHVYQDEIHPGTLANPGATLPGLKEITGVIQPVRFFGENGLLLEMADGRRLKFFFTDSRGSIALNSWIG